MNSNCCPLCKKGNSKTTYKKDELHIFKCNDCGLLFIFPQPTDEEINLLYSEEYYKPWGLNTDLPALSEMKKATFTNYLELIEKYKPIGSVLDIGCATGLFLEVAHQRGWDVHGVEISGYSAEIAQKKFGSSTVLNGSLESASYRQYSFDVVFMSDLIEHVKDLHTFLHEVFRVLKKDGLIMIVTPNASSLSLRTMRSYWPHFKKEHLYYFSASSIEGLLKREGFHPIHITASSKAINIGYFERQLSSYPVPILTPLLKMMVKAMPLFLRRKNFFLRTGELLVIAKKTGDK